MKNALCLLAMSVLLCSCTHYFYAPNTQNVPALREQGEFRAMVGALTADEIDGYEAQLAFSPVKHLGLMANYATVDGGEGEEGGKGRQAEAGIGYYLPVGEIFTFETYAGYGSGRVSNYYASGHSYSHKFGKAFLQPSFGYCSDFFDALFSTRLAYLNIRRETNFVDSTSSAYPVLLTVDNTPRAFLVEPAITLRVGWKYIKLQTQLGFSYNLTEPAFPQEDMIISIGLYISSTPRWRAAHRKPADRPE